MFRLQCFICFIISDNEDELFIPSQSRKWARKVSEFSDISEGADKIFISLGGLVKLQTLEYVVATSQFILDEIL